MTRKEIAVHLISEIRGNEKRIKNYVFFVAKEMKRAKKRVQTYQQRVGNDTMLTVYIYGIDDEGVDYAVGVWCHSERGLCWATAGQLDDVVFYNGHFFQRYAERFLKKSMATSEAALEFYREFKPTIARHTEEIKDGVYRTQLPLRVGGLALGIHDRASQIIVYNTYVSVDLLGEKQLDDVDADKDLNEAIQQMDSSEWKILGEFLK